MTRFVVDAGAVLHIIDKELVVADGHKLLAPTLLRSQVLSMLYEAVQRGELAGRRSGAAGADRKDVDQVPGRRRPAPAGVGPGAPARLGIDLRRRIRRPHAAAGRRARDARPRTRQGRRRPRASRRRSRSCRAADGTRGGTVPADESTGDEGVAACRTSSPGWRARSRSSPGPGACARSAGRSPSSWPGPAATSCSPVRVDPPTATPTTSRRPAGATSTRWPRRSRPWAAERCRSSPTSPTSSRRAPRATWCWTRSAGSTSS